MASIVSEIFPIVAFAADFAMAGLLHVFTHPSVIRGFHVYGNTVNWRPSMGEHLKFKQEHSNPHDQFAVAGQTTSLNGRHVTVGHVPREISRHVWYALEYGATITGRVTDPIPKRSPLIQGGLEIRLEITVVWDDYAKTEILKNKLHSISFDGYSDESNQILTEMGVETSQSESEIDSSQNESDSEGQEKDDSEVVEYNCNEFGTERNSETESDLSTSDTDDVDFQKKAGCDAESDDSLSDIEKDIAGQKRLRLIISSDEGE